MGFLKNKTGPEVIDSVVAEFQEIIRNLNEGLNLCETKKNSNAEKIEKLNSENEFLEEKTTQAKTFRDNLKNMMSISSENKEEKE